MADWKKKVAQLNKDRFKVPSGWDTKEQVATSLECSPDRVADLLKPGLQAGEIERQDFPVWDESRRMTVRATCYRMVDKQAPCGGLKPFQGRVGAQAKPKGKVAINKVDRIKGALARYPKLSNYAVAHKLHKVSAAEVAEVRSGLGL